MLLAKTIVLVQDTNVNFRRIYPPLKREKASRMDNFSCIAEIFIVEKPPIK